MKTRPISKLFKHEGTLYVYCSSIAVKALFTRHLAEQGFLFGDGASPQERPIESLMCVHRDYTIGFCGFVCHMQYGIGEKDALEYCKSDGARNATRIDYARYISGEKKYVMRRKRGLARAR